MTNKQRPPVGSWTYHCCHRDLHQIENQQDIDSVLECQEDGEVFTFFPTEKEALIKIRGDFADQNFRKEIKEIDERLTKL